MGCRGERRPAVCGLVGPTRGSESLRGGWTKPPGWGLEPEGTELDVHLRCKVLGAQLLLSGGTVCEDQREEGKMEGDRNDAGMQEGEKEGRDGGKHTQAAALADGSTDRSARAQDWLRYCTSLHRVFQLRLLEIGRASCRE